MPSSDSPNDNDVSPQSATPDSTPPVMNKEDEEDKAQEDGGDGHNNEQDGPATPHSKKAHANADPDTPKSAPAAVAAHRRQRSSSRKQADPPTLLADFFMGKPSPARLAAERRRRQSVEAVKAELRHEMKQNAVRKVQPPGGVKDRVKAWQKANAAVATAGSADDAATEPTDLAFGDEDGVESVTEEDRVRIKMRQKKKNNGLKVKPVVHGPEDMSSKPTDDGENMVNNGSASPPKKRVVSDEHWMKMRSRRSPPRKVSPRTRRRSPTTGSGGGHLPKDFTLRSAPNPNISNRVKAWADKVEVPDTPSPRSYRSSKSRDRSLRVEDTDTEVLSEDAASSSQGTARQSLRLRQPGSADDGVRIKPVRRKKLHDDGIRVTPVNSTTQDDDGIRVRATSEVPSEVSTGRSGPTRVIRQRSKTLPSSRRPNLYSPRAEIDEDATELSETTGLTRDTRSDRIEVIEEPDSTISTPTKQKGANPSTTSKMRPKSHHPGTAKTRDDSSWIDDGNSSIGASQLLGSDLSSSLANKSVADLPGDIPWGHSAFSELDLPLNGPARSRPKQPQKVDRNSSLKAMPGVFKKVVEEGKKMIHEMNEQPKVAPASNKPPSIERWLHNTVDPFVDDRKDAKPAPEKSSEPADQAHKARARDSAKKSSPEPERVLESAKSTPVKDRSRQPTRRKSSQEASTPKHSRSKSDFTSEASSLPQTEGTDATPAYENTSGRSARTPDSAGLKRSRAVRSTSSPSKAMGKRPFLGMLKEAFTGESSGHNNRSFSYTSQELRYEDETEEEQTVSGYDSQSGYTYDETPSASELSSADPVEPTTPRMAGPRFRPPTNGNHELSTILSEEDSSAVSSDLTSDASQSTLTQSTVLTKDSETSKTKDQEPGLKRRLTKHSDLVSVLSLPDNKDIPDTIKNTRSRPSLRKTRGFVDSVTAEELLGEFADDESLYMRELKTLVDGVVPVLLSQVVQGGHTTDLFGTDSSERKLDGLSKSVVGMGVSLEKLRTAHRKAPHHDLRRLAHWAHGVVPIYNSYLNSWRLGFQDLVVNLAPASGVSEDEDSLLNAMPRNESGDIVNADGERVDVAHLLKRPLIRIKHLVKFIECVDSLMPSEDTSELLHNFKDLQDKSRRRHREETARLTDEEASNTDTTRSRDMRTLAPLDYYLVNPRLQVNAKDIFSLDLAHSNGQRLECQVELVHRDSHKEPQNSGDLLIRETGDGGRAYLLFPPISMSSLSARTGEGNFDMVVMIRGTHNGRPWHELLTLTSDNEDQILDWLDILPLSPVPPREPEPSVIGEDEFEASPKPIDIPVGARSIRRKGPRTRDESPRTRDELPSQRHSTPPRRSGPSRSYAQKSPLLTTPPRIDEEEEYHSPLDKTPTQDDYDERPREETDHSRPLRENMRPDPLNLAKKPGLPYYREDEAPPPPIHRTFGSARQSEAETEEEPPKSRRSSIKPPVELKGDSKVKRRTSSPLKHEYLPSDRSSASGLSAGSESDPDYSDSEDELESVDIPETEIGFSIKEESRHRPPPEPRSRAPESRAVPVQELPEETIVPPPVESLLGDSECSLTPSNSASQAGINGQKLAPEEKETAQRFMATISRWSDKGAWKDLTSTPCSVIVTPGLVEAYIFQDPSLEQTPRQPLLAMDLTPLVLIRQSTTVDLEIRSSLQSHCQLAKSAPGGNFRFRCGSGPDCFGLYMSVHHARLNNQKFIQLENEARFKSFGERQAPVENDGDTSSRRRSWFGRKNSYRGSVRAPSQSHDGASTTPSSNVSATSFLKRLSAAGNMTFNLAKSSVDKQSRPGSVRNSLYTSGSSSASGTPPRSPSISLANSGQDPANLTGENIRIRLHLLITSSKWEDYGNCILQIRRPPPGWRQALRADHGLEKRVTVTTMPKKDSEKPRILLDAVLGSGCFTPMGSRGIVCGVWEEVRDKDGVVGMVPATGATGGNIKKWCFQCASAGEAGAVLRLVHQEVLRA